MSTYQMVIGSCRDNETESPAASRSSDSTFAKVEVRKAEIHSARGLPAESWDETIEVNVPREMVWRVVISTVYESESRRDSGREPYQGGRV